MPIQHAFRIRCVLTHIIPRVSSTDPHKKHQLSTPGFQRITWVEFPSESPQIMEMQMSTVMRGHRWQIPGLSLHVAPACLLADRLQGQGGRKQSSHPAEVHKLVWGELGLWVYAEACLRECPRKNNPHRYHGAFT